MGGDAVYMRGTSLKWRSEADALVREGWLGA